jgi:hypothetical protein
MTDIWTIIAKRAAAGEATPFKKRDFYNVIAERAAAARRDHETSESSFARFITEDREGKILFKAYRLAPGPDFTVEVKKTEPPAPPSTPALDRLNAKAEELRKIETKLTFVQAFAKVYTKPENRELVDEHRAERNAARR